MNLNQNTYDEVKKDPIAFEKVHLNKKDQLKDEKKNTIVFKAITNKVGNALDKDELSFLTKTVVVNYKRFRNKKKGNKTTQKKNKLLNTSELR